MAVHGCDFYSRASLFLSKIEPLRQTVPCHVELGSRVAHYDVYKSSVLNFGERFANPPFDGANARVGRPLKTALVVAMGKVNRYPRSSQ